MRALICCLAVLVAGGCAARADRTLEVMAESPGPVRGEIMRQSVELRHSAQGWVTVDFEGTPATAAALPHGAYDAVRIKYLTWIPSAEEGSTSKDATESSEVSWVETEAVVEEEFCVGSKDPELALQMVRDAKDDRMSARVTLDAPCEESARELAAAADADRRGAARLLRRDRQ